MRKKLLAYLSIGILSTSLFMGCQKKEATITVTETTEASENTEVAESTEVSESTEAADTTEAGEIIETIEDETVYQVALLQSLMLGDYTGSVSVGELKKHGDIGLGTFQDVNGEMIVLDGVVYQALSDGSIAVADDNVMIPFSNVTMFDADITIDFEMDKDLAGLQEILDEKVADNGSNQFYVAKITGDFPTMNVRSEYAQKEPYKPLAEVMKTDQVFFDYENIKGTVVALYCPDYMDGLNTPGWHYHFISEDKTKGGHVLGLTISKALIELDATASFDMALPTEDHFQDLELTTNLKDDIKAVEKND